MVLCVIPGCGNRTGRDQGVGFYRIPAVVTNKGEFEEKLTAESVCYRLLMNSKSTGFTVCLTYSDTLLSMYINQC